MGDLQEVHPSIWVATSPSVDYGLLRGTFEVDVAIIGAGITGLSAALLLSQAGHTVAVLEAGAIASGTTGYTTAKLSSLHGLTHADIADAQGEDHARAYGEAAQSAIEAVAALIDEHGIDCDFERMPAFTYTQDTHRVGDIEREVEAAQKAGLPASHTTNTDLPYEIEAAVRFEDQAVFHPRKYCAALARLITDAGGQVFDKTRVTGIDAGNPHVVTTEHGRVGAAHVIQATQLPLHDPGRLFRQTSPSRSYCLAQSRGRPHRRMAHLRLGRPDPGGRQVVGPRRVIHRPLGRDERVRGRGEYVHDAEPAVITRSQHRPSLVLRRGESVVEVFTWRGPASAAACD